MEMSPGASRMFARLLETHTGQELAAGRHWRLATALNPVMKANNILSLDGLATRVEQASDRALGLAVVEALLNNETSFFRDPAAFALLTGEALDRLAASRAKERSLRIWCAGCSTGQEAYSIAMHFAEDAARWEGWRIEIVATDVSPAAIAQARAGRYNQFEVQRGLPIRRMMQWFEPDGDNWRATLGLRHRVRFQISNLLCETPSPCRFDVVLCRNVLMYFPAEVRTRAFDALAGVVAADGYLMLGAGETVIGQTRRFTSDTDFRGLYRLAT